MKKHGLLIGIAVLLTAMVFTFAGCKNDTNSGTAKSIKITGIPSGSNGKEALVTLIPSIEGDDDPVAFGAGTVTSGTFAAALLNEDESEWTGSGSYYIYLQVEGVGEYITLAKHNFTDAVTEIAYGSFTPM